MGGSGTREAVRVASPEALSLADVARQYAEHGRAEEARILLDGAIRNVQVSWVKMGVEACQAILRGGANDFGGTLMEETISRMAGAEWGIRMEPWEIEDAIRAIGRIPVERTTTYGRLHRNGVGGTRDRAANAVATRSFT